MSSSTSAEKKKNAPETADEKKSSAPPRRSGFARELVLAALRRLEAGSLELREGSEVLSFGSSGPRASLEVHNPALFEKVLRGGTLGAGEAYMDGDWSSAELSKVVRVIARNEAIHRGLKGRVGMLKKLADGLRHWLRRNSLTGARQNIAEHYDLGNDFFKLFLDESMMYSAAIFQAEPGTSESAESRLRGDLEDAQRRKLDRICRKLALEPGDRVLEIGTGWGGFAIHAAKNYGCHVTTTTISKEQLEEARARVAAAGLNEKITLLEEDYRSLTGVYDKLVSIEMIEAVGHEYLPRYFEVLARRLEPGGIAALQVILLPDYLYEESRRGVDFIKKYIFPGCQCPSLLAMTQAWSQSTDFSMIHFEDLSPHYARTLATWRERFMARLDEVRALGYPERFIRMWDYYLSLCEGGFSERAISSAQLLLARPGYRGQVQVDPL